MANLTPRVPVLPPPPNPDDPAADLIPSEEVPLPALLQLEIMLLDPSAVGQVRHGTAWQPSPHASTTLHHAFMH